VKLCPKETDSRLDFLALDHPMHSYYQSLLNPPKQVSEEQMAERRRRTIELLKASGVMKDEVKAEEESDMEKPHDNQVQ